MNATREPHWPAHVTLTREPDRDPLVPPLPPEGFRPPSEMPSRLVRVGSTGGTLVREFCDDLDRPAADPHFDEEAARQIARDAADSILRPAHLANRSTNHD